MLDRTRPGGRKFRRIAGERLVTLLRDGGLELPADAPQTRGTGETGGDATG